ncbi:dTDP-4-dehydrorhamnose reductase [Jeongeupia chitinilytica]|uniref:dTDP-4-dehydrorhamnose reductase n=1 Tax=Jeongeupia chitinilytica TaxID=1041641 RepID=A0ABQ3H422_9NEIS|nr:dTDP-4-dehydrorhamnose reductase [Jeongeupia chitinilytica]GHD67457.1 NAD(P)-dependent oxidoreductase [Jeongeupia chitinilytica]
MTLPVILLTGKNGQVGFELQRSLAILGQVVAVDRADCDLSNAAAVAALLERVCPDIIVNPAAHTAVDQAETEADLAQTINTAAPAAMAQWAKAHQALLLHFSTDYVFDGRKEGWYGEDDAPNPQSVYGKTKLAGEAAIRASGCRHLILRTSWVFGAHGGNFLKSMLKLMAERDSLRVIADQIGSPTSAALLADVSAQLLAQYWRAPQRADFAYGTYHTVAAGETSWHGYAQEINCQAGDMGWVFKLNADAIVAIPASDYPLPAPRPTNSRLATAKLQTAFGLTLPDWRQGLRQTLTLLKA